MQVVSHASNRALVFLFQEALQICLKSPDEIMVILATQYHPV